MKSRGRKSTKVTLGVNVRRLRLELRLSQEELGELVKLSQNSVSAIETGSVATNLDVVDRLAAALKCAASDLLVEPNAARA